MLLTPKKHLHPQKQQWNWRSQLHKCLTYPYKSNQIQLQWMVQHPVFQEFSLMFNTLALLLSNCLHGNKRGKTLHQWCRTLFPNPTHVYVYAHQVLKQHFRNPVSLSKEPDKLTDKCMQTKRDYKSLGSTRGWQHSAQYLSSPSYLSSKTSASNPSKKERSAGRLHSQNGSWEEQEPFTNTEIFPRNSEFISY